MACTPLLSLIFIYLVFSFKLLHCFNKGLAAFNCHCVVAACTEATNIAVSLDTNHSSFSSELKELILQFCILIVENEADVLVSAIFLTLNCTTEQLIAIDLTVNNISPLLSKFLHCLYTTICFNPTKVL